MQVQERSFTDWLDTRDIPGANYEGQQILVCFESFRVSTITWRSAIGFPGGAIKWAPLPIYRPNTKVVINRSFGRFAISDACRRELGLDANRSSPNYISDAEVRQNCRFSKTLVAAVEKLGFLASAPGSNLEIVEVPGCYPVHDIIICERNGYEHIEIASQYPEV